MSNTNFIDQLYIRFLGRPADAAGLAYWNKVLDNGIANAAQVTQHFLDSPEFANAVQPLARLYYTAFGRIPDAAGLSYWLQQAQAGVPLDAIGKAFASSAEFTAAYGKMDNNAFIDAIWHAALGRTTDTPFKSTWMASLERGASRADLLASLANSHEVIVHKTEAIKVIAQYHGALGMAPTQHEINTALMRKDPVGLLTNLYGRADYHGADVPNLISRGVAEHAGAVVFIDKNGNGALDTNELSVMSNSLGEYSFDHRATFEGTLVELPVVHKSTGGGSQINPVDNGLTLDSHSPSTYDSNASTSTFVFTFSDPVLPNAGYIRITNGTSQTYISGGTLQSRIVGATDTRLISVSDAQVSISGNVVTVTLNTPLAGGSNYSLIIDQGAFKDASNKLFAGIRDTTQLPFTTTASADTTRPEALQAYFETGGLLKIGDSVQISVTFSEVVYGFGSPTLLFDVGNGSTASAALTGGEGTNTLTFTYYVQQGHTTEALSLALSSGTYGSGLLSKVKDEAGNFVDANSIKLTAALGFAGSPSTADEYKIIRVDGVEPLKSAAPSLDPGWDTGINTDEITSHTTLKFNGSGVQVGDFVELYISGQNIPVGTSSAVVDFNSGWTITANGVPPGDNYFYIVVVDPAGNRSVPSNPTLVTVDTGAVVLTNIAFSDGEDTGIPDDEITNVASPYLNGTGAEPGARVELFEMDEDDELVSLGYTTADGNGDWEIPVNKALGNATHTIYAKQTDIAGNVSALSSGFTFTVDTSRPGAPTGTPDIGAGDDTGTSGTDNITKTTNPTVSGTGATPGAKINIYLDDSPLTSVTADGNGNWTLSGHTFSESTVLNPHVIYVTESDVAGNESDPSGELELVIDTTAPGAAYDLDLDVESDLGTSLSDNQTSDNTPRITGKAEVGATVTLKNGTDTIGTATVANGGAWSITPSTALANGDYNFTAYVKDKAGNESVVSSTLAVKIFTTTLAAPTALDLVSGDDLGSSNSDNITKDVRPTITGSATANGTVELYANFIKVGTAVADANGSWSIPLTSDLLHGEVNFIANLVDTYGNVSADSAGLTVTIDTEAPSAPSGTPAIQTASNSGSTSDNITNQPRPTITGSGAVANGLVGIYDCDVLITTVTANGSGLWSYTPATDLSHGEHTFQAVNIDTAGNESPKTAGLVVTIDLQTPTAPAAPDMRTADDLGTSSSDNSTSVQSPHFTGTGAEAGTTIKLYNGATEIGSAVVAGDGSYDITPTTPFSNGSHTLTLTATDVAGNVSLASSSTTITIQNTTLATPVFPLLYGDDDLGSSSSDGITSDTTPRVYSTQATPNGSIEVYEGATLLGTATADGYGNWMSTLSTLAEGAHTVYAVLVDQYGNKSGNSTTLTFTIDTTPPVAIATAPSITSGTDSGFSSSDAKTNDTTPTITGSGAVNNGWVAIYVNGSYVMKTQANSDGVYTHTVESANALTGGVYSITVRNIDVAGNHSATASPSLTLGTDTVAPDALTAPDLMSADDKGTSNSDNKTSDDTPRVSGTAEAGALVELYEGATLLGQAYADITTQAWEITSSALANGSHTLTLYSTDIFGNKSTISPSTTVDIFKTTYTAPSAPDLNSGSDTGTSSIDNLTSDTTPTFSGTATLNSTVSLYEGSTFLGTATATGYGNWTITTSVLADGEHTIVAVVEDEYGNKSADSTSITITVEVDAPAAPTAAPDLSSASDTGSSNADNTTSSSEPEISGTGAVPNARVNIYVNNAYDGYAIAANDGSWNYDLYLSTALDKEDFSVTVRHVNLAGVEGPDSPALVITFDDNEPEAENAPELDTGSNSGDSGDTKTNDTTPLIKGVSEPFATVHLFNGQTLVTTVSADEDGIWSHQFTTPLAAQEHELSYTVTDLAGNTSESSPVLELDISTSAPDTVSTLDFDDDDDTSTYGASSTDNITVRYSDLTFTGVTNTANGTVTLYADGDEVGTASLDPQGNFELTLEDDLAEGEYDIQAKVTDIYGNTSTFSTVLELKIDRTAPNVPGIPTVASAITNNASPTMTVTASSDTVRVNFYHDGDPIGYTTTKNGSGNFEFSGYPGIEDGVHGITARAVDAAGNESADSATLSLTIDTYFDPPAPALLSASDTGVSNTDGITNAATPQLSGSGLMPNSTDAKIWINGDDEPLTVDASGNWTYGFETGGQTYTIYVTGRDAAGNSGITGTLTVVHDPYLTTPSLGTSWAINAPIVLAFSEVMDWTSGSITLQKGTDAPVSLTPANASFSNGDKTITLTSGYTLVEGATYTLSFPATFRDTAGNVPSTITFGTDNPTVSSYTFTGNNLLTLNFSETVSFGTGSLLVKKVSDGTTMLEITSAQTSYWHTIDSDTLTFDITGIPSGDYYVEIQNSITDTSSNYVEIIGSSTITFTRIPA